jgi:6-pyruvoyltetrahydropterin/6-carboxytetrahydropterin synthase
MVTICKRFTFDAAHHLPTMPVHHKCHRMHGHTYGVELIFAGKVDANGFCAGIDYGDIAAVWSRIERVVDHVCLNDIKGLEVPSTENLAPWIAREFVENCGHEHSKMAAHLVRVRVSESSTTWCEYEIKQAWRKPTARRAA